MSTVPVESWVENLRAGTIDLSDLDSLARLSFDRLVRQLGEAYPICFLRRQTGTKRELGLAERARSYTSRGRALASRIFHNCLLLTEEGGRLTTIASLTEVRFRPLATDPDTFELSSGAGFSLYRDPDGWKIKRLERRTIRLPETALQRHGWLAEPENATA